MDAILQGQRPAEERSRNQAQSPAPKRAQRDHDAIDNQSPTHRNPSRHDDHARRNMKNILKHIPGPLSVTWVVITAALLILLKIQNPAVVESLQLKGFDTLLSSDQVEQSNEVVVIDIGEPSMVRLGQWPWDRRELAHAVQRIHELGASTIILPILMTEKDRLNGDPDLAKVLGKTPTVIAQSPTTQNKKPDAVRRGVAAIGGDPYLWLFKWPGALSPRPELAQSAKGVGTTIVAPEIDGVVRRMPLVVTVNKEYYPSLAIEALRVFTGEQSYQMKMSSAGVEKVRIAGQPVIDTDANGRVWLRWNKEFKHYELGDLSRKDVNLKGKIVVFLYPTPNCLKQSFFSSYIKDGLKYTMTKYKQI